jgi:hypothetical protein
MSNLSRDILVYPSRVYRVGILLIGGVALLLVDT